MNDRYTAMIRDVRSFLGAPGPEAHRPPFDPRHDAVRAGILVAARQFADHLAQDLTEKTGLPHAGKVLRVDRTLPEARAHPSHRPEMQILWSRTDAVCAPAWVFAASPDRLTFGMGIQGLRDDALIRYRALVDARGDALLSATAQAERTVGARLSDRGTPPLKRVPKTYPPDHRHADLLRRRDFTLVADLSDDWQARGLRATLSAMLPAFRDAWILLTRGLDRPPRTNRPD